MYICCSKLGVFCGKLLFTDYCTKNSLMKSKSNKKIDWRRIIMI